MKKNQLKKSLVGASAIVGGLIACDSEEIDLPFESGIDDKFVTNKDVQIKSVAVSLSDEYNLYVTIAQKIANDICSYPDLAKEFVDNPQLFFSKYGYEKEINLDDGFVRLLTAYADDEIRQAIRDNDLATVVRLCHKKKIFDGAVSEINLEYEFEKALKDANYNAQIQPYSWFWFAQWLAFASAYLGFSAVYNFSAYTDVHVEGIVAALSDNASGFNLKLLWNVVSDKDSIQFVSTNDCEKVVDEILLVLKDVRPELFEEFSEIEIRNQIATSLYGTIL